MAEPQTRVGIDDWPAQGSPLSVMRHSSLVLEKIKKKPTASFASFQHVIPLKKLLVDMSILVPFGGSLALHLLGRPWHSRGASKRKIKSF